MNREEIVKRMEILAWRAEEIGEYELKKNIMAVLFDPLHVYLGFDEMATAYKAGLMQGVEIGRKEAEALTPSPSPQGEGNPKLKSDEELEFESWREAEERKAGKKMIETCPDCGETVFNCECDVEEF